MLYTWMGTDLYICCTYGWGQTGIYVVHLDGDIPVFMLYICCTCGWGQTGIYVVHLDGDIPVFMLYTWMGKERYLCCTRVWGQTGIYVLHVNGHRPLCCTRTDQYLAYVFSLYGDRLEFLLYWGDIDLI